VGWRVYRKTDALNNMDIKKLLEKYSLTEHPVGLGGCQNHDNSYSCCEYDLSVFDEKLEEDTIIEFENSLVTLHHCSLSETHSNVLAQFAGLKIILDEKWELRMLLAKINEKKDQIYKDYMKNCLIDSLFCITKAREGLKSSDPFFSSWIKCAAFYLADSILLYNSIRPSPAHFLQNIRTLPNDKVSEKFSIVNDCIGIERATTSLLERMCKSTIGFSDMVEGNDHSKIIESKYNYFIENSLLTDCYFYLGYINRNNVIKIKDKISQRPDLIHVLKVAFDIENDTSIIEKQADMFYEATNEILSLK